jgi:hypothetical protein
MRATLPGAIARAPYHFTFREDEREAHFDPAFVVNWAAFGAGLKRKVTSQIPVTDPNIR